MTFFLFLYLSKLLIISIIYPFFFLFFAHFYSGDYFVLYYFLIEIILLVSFYLNAFFDESPEQLIDWAVLRLRTLLF